MLTQSPNIFSYLHWRLQQQRAARAHDGADNPILHEITHRLAERVGEITRRLPHTALLDGPSISADMLRKQPSIHQLDSLAIDQQCAAQGHDQLNIPAQQYDALFSLHCLGQMNDVPGVLAQCARALKPDGLLLASLPGPETLKELRQVLTLSETEQKGGISARVHPFMDVRDAGNLLTRTGFNLPVIDRDIITIHYPDMFALITDLRQSGQGNILTNRNKATPGKGLFARANALYHEQFGTSDGGIYASYELITLTAWKPAASQPKPLAPGSGKISLTQLFE